MNRHYTASSWMKRPLSVAALALLGLQLSARTAHAEGSPSAATVTTHAEPPSPDVLRISLRREGSDVALRIALFEDALGGPIVHWGFRHVEHGLADVGIHAGKYFTGAIGIAGCSSSPAFDDACAPRASAAGALVAAALKIGVDAGLGGGNEAPTEPTKEAATRTWGLVPQPILSRGRIGLNVGGSF
jgi:hypothetical protein